MASNLRRITVNAASGDLAKGAVRAELTKRHLLATIIQVEEALDQREDSEVAIIVNTKTYPHTTRRTWVVTVERNI